MTKLERTRWTDLPFPVRPGIARPGITRPGITRLRISTTGLLAFCLCAGTGAARAQDSTAPAAGFTRVADTSLLDVAASVIAVSPQDTTSSSLVASAALPEAPVPQLSQPTPVAHSGPGQKPVARRNAKYIPPGWVAQPLTAGGKFKLAFGDQYSFEDLTSIFVVAGYEQVLNSQPNYGTDRGAFGERLGAAAIREGSQGFLTDGVFASLLHEDPRYYEEGSSRSVFHRTLYAISRPLITRTDTGGSTVNGALLIGYASAAALTPAYYPAANRDFKDVVDVYGGSIGGAALGFFIAEFSQDALKVLHLEHNQNQ